MAIGAMLWGWVAGNWSVSTALLASAGSAGVGLFASGLFPMSDNDPHRLVPSQHWPAPPIVPPNSLERGRRWSPWNTASIPPGLLPSGKLCKICARSGCAMELTCGSSSWTPRIPAAIKKFSLSRVGLNICVSMSVSPRLTRKFGNALAPSTSGLNRHEFPTTSLRQSPDRVSLIAVLGELWRPCALRTLFQSGKLPLNGRRESQPVLLPTPLFRTGRNQIIPDEERATHGPYPIGTKSRAKSAPIFPATSCPPGPAPRVARPPDAPFLRPSGALTRSCN